MPEPISIERLAEIRDHGASWLDWPLPAESGTVEQAGRDITDLLAEVDRLRGIEKTATEFLAARAGVVRTLRQCVDDIADYYRWQGHSEARRVLSQMLGWPVVWPVEDAQKASAEQTGGGS